VAAFAQVGADLPQTIRVACFVVRIPADEEVATSMERWQSLWSEPGAHAAAGAAVLLAAAWLTGALARFMLFRVVRGLARRTAWRWDEALFEHGVFLWLSRLVPAVVVQFGIELVPALPAQAARMVINAAAALMVFFAVMAANAALSALEALYRGSPDGSRRSIKGLVQLAKLGLFIAAALVIIVGFTGRSIGWMLSGLGAMSAVLMLVFKDTILGFVAGLQLSSSDMLRVGDWITMPAAGADGDVVDIALYTVKVRNFDQTIVTVPTWKLISESYQNWRGMSEAGGRRIKRALLIDAASVRFMEPEELAALSQLRLLRDHLAAKRDDLEHWNGALGDDAAILPNRRRLTNLGTFRAYATAYLDGHPQIRRDMTCMVRQLPGGAQGVPLELYCFTATTDWADYEAIQADLFDHLIAVLPVFGLKLYQQPSGYDLRETLARLAPSRAESPFLASHGKSKAWHAST
jgi:miniconductance mechanosensitive channel